MFADSLAEEWEGRIQKAATKAATVEIHVNSALEVAHIFHYCPNRVCVVFVKHMFKHISIVCTREVASMWTIHTHETRKEKGRDERVANNAETCVICREQVVSVQSLFAQRLAFRPVSMLSLCFGSGVESGSAASLAL